MCQGHSSLDWHWCPTHRRLRSLHSKPAKQTRLVEALASQLALGIAATLEKIYCCNSGQT